jgi:cbb3-type cytochrome oxidase subunit 1
MAFSNTQATTYSDKVVRQFAIMTVVWGVVGMLVGVIVAAQLAWPELNLGISFLSFGRLRPLHTNAVIFAFGGCGLFATAYYVVQRTCQVRACLRGLGNVHVLGLAVGHCPSGCIPCLWGTRQPRSTPNWSGQSTILITVGLGGLRHRVLWHHRNTQSQAHLCR